MHLRYGDSYESRGIPGDLEKPAPPSNFPNKSRLATAPLFQNPPRRDRHDRTAHRRGAGCDENPPQLRYRDALRPAAQAQRTSWDKKMPPAGKKARRHKSNLRGKIKRFNAETVGGPFRNRVADVRSTNALPGR